MSRCCRGKTAAPLQFAAGVEQAREQAQEEDLSSREQYVIPAQILNLKGYGMCELDPVAKPSGSR